MGYQRGRIIEVEFPVQRESENDDEDSGGDIIVKKHPAVILSVPKVFDAEQYYLCAMISSSAGIDVFTFELEQEMTTPKMTKACQVRTHLIAQIWEADIVSDSPIRSINNNAFKALVQHINTIVFGVDTIV